MIEKIYRYLAEEKIIRFLMSILSFIYRSIKVKKINISYLKNIEWINEMNINDFFKKRKKWISWILRTKDWWLFLEKVVKSFIDYVDELVIINNNSSDNTKEICFKLINEFWDKVKYYEYNYDIIRDLNKTTSSINSFAYYSNWSISKASYSTIFKVDDDNLFIDNLISNQIQKVRSMSKYCNKIYYYYWWLNFYKKNDFIWVVNDNPYSWKYWDIWFFNISEKTYFIQSWVSEKLINNYFYFDLDFSYIHLKYFKEWRWLKYAPKYLKEYFNNLLNKSRLVSVKKYTNKITDNECNNILEKIIPNNL